MEPKNLLIGLIIGVFASLAVFTWMAGLNIAYSSDMGGTFNSSISRVQSNLEDQLTGISYDLANNTQMESGASTSSQEEGILSKSWNTFSSITSILGVIPSTFSGLAEALHIPQQYVNIAVAAFWISLSMTLAYILLVGAKKLL